MLVQSGPQQIMYLSTFWRMCKENLPANSPDSENMMLSWVWRFAQPHTPPDLSSSNSQVFREDVIGTPLSTCLKLSVVLYRTLDLLRPPRTNAFSLKPRYDRKNDRDSLYCMGPRLFNSIPSSLRGLGNKKGVGKIIIETFKKDLDEYLKTAPDNPGSHNNSLVNICMKKGSHHRGT